MTFGMPTLIAFLAAFVTVIALVPVSSRLARAANAVTTPRADRWNRRAVPMLGGIAIFGGIVVAVCMLPLGPTDRIALLVGLSAIFLVGLVDDLRTISAVVRLLIEAAVGAAFVWFVSVGLTTELRVAAVLLAAVAIPVAVNATNLTDNADGLAATLALATAATLTVAGVLAKLDTATSALALAIGITAAAFLLFNRPPARVFMGDSGSLVLGFALAASSVLLVRDALLIPGNTHIATAMAVPVAWAFQVGDLGMVVVTRVRRGVSPFSGGVDHTSHRLMAAGITPWILLASLGLLAALVGSAAAVAAAFFGGFVLMAVVAISLLILVAAFEAAVAWRLPRVPDVALSPRDDSVPNPAVRGRVVIDRSKAG
jgi:UDP-GlcNAc:undecaprenyl-phosphate GlcNAc-1-phosphate transferase